MSERSDPVLADPEPRRLTDADVDDSTAPFTPECTPSLTPPAVTAPVVQVVERTAYVPVGDLTFGGNRQIDDAPTDPVVAEMVKTAFWVENQAERTLRELLEKLGLRLKRSWTWVQVMNRVRKARLEIMEYPAPVDGGWHILREGRVIARVSYPWWDAQGHLKFWVS